MKYGIIGAMDEEISHLKSKMEISEEITIANSLFIRGNISAQEVIIVKSGIGKVNAAMTTTILLERFAPDVIINTGSAGGFASELNVGDLVIASEVVHHDVDVTAFDYAYGQVPRLPRTFKSDPTLIERVQKQLRSLNLRYRVGLIATGDSFMSDPAKVAFVREKFPEMLAAEMEGAAIAQVCYMYEKPFIIIRALSDIAGKDSPISFEQFIEVAGKNAANVILHLLQD